MNLVKYIKIVGLSLLTVCIIFAGIFAANYIGGNSGGNGDDAGVTAVTGKRINVLVMATDESGLRTDTIMLASFDKGSKQVNILSVPRDTRVVSGNSHVKINSLYGMGKEESRQELIINKITELTGLPINYYAVVNPDGFSEIVDILDGVEIDVPVRMKYSDPTQDLYIDLQPGLQVLDGDKAEQFCRFRSYPDGDLARIEAQQNFMKELVKQKLKPKYIFRAKSIFKKASEFVYTNITAKDMAVFLPLIKLMNSDCVNTYSLPGNPQYISGISYFIYDKAKTDELINEVFVSDIPEEEI